MPVMPGPAAVRSRPPACVLALRLLPVLLECGAGPLAAPPGLLRHFLTGRRSHFLRLIHGLLLVGLSATLSLDTARSVSLRKGFYFCNRHQIIVMFNTVLQTGGRYRKIDRLLVIIARK